MKPTIIAKNKSHLINLIQQEIKLNGEKCDLNHIDVSKINDFSEVFKQSRFDGNISEWNTSNAENMHEMFLESNFNGDISRWNIVSLKDMEGMFADSRFDGDISGWDVSKVESMDYLFADSLSFSKNLTNWKPYSLNEANDIFMNCDGLDIPYWAEYDDPNKRRLAIDNYWLKGELNKTLTNQDSSTKKLKL